MCGGSCDCPVPHCLDRSLVRASERGLYHAKLASAALPVPLGVPTTWTVRLLGPDDKPVENVLLTADGGMPQHGHGYPVAPVITPLGAGQHRITGLEFTAPGWWLLRLTITAAADIDAVTFNLVLGRATLRASG
jgi:hypothetical protein